MKIEEKLRAEIKILRRWKREALQVLKQLDSQAIAKELNIPLGADINPLILPAIIEMKAKISTLEIKLSEARRRTISLDGSNGEINFLPISVTRTECKNDLLHIRSCSGIETTIGMNRRVELTVLADLLDEPQITLPRKE